MGIEYAVPVPGTGTGIIVLVLHTYLLGNTCEMILGRPGRPMVRMSRLVETLLIWFRSRLPRFSASLLKARAAGIDFWIRQQFWPPWRRQVGGSMHQLLWGWRNFSCIRAGLGVVPVLDYLRHRYMRCKPRISKTLLARPVFITEQTVLSGSEKL
jgi:hypothetical protein